MTVSVPALRTRADFGKRLALTLAILFVYEMGTIIPLPLRQTASLFLQFITLPENVDTFETFAAPKDVYIFSFGFSSFFSVLIAVEIAKLAFSGLTRWEAASARNAANLQGAILVAALALTAFKGFDVASQLQQITTDETYIAILTYVAGTALVGWLMSQITMRGLGNGFWVLAAATMAGDLPRVLSRNLEMVQTRDIGAWPITIAIGFLIGAVMLLVFVDLPWQESDSRHAPTNGFGTSSALAMTVWPPTLAKFAFSEFLIVVQFFNPDVIVEHWLLMEVIWGCVSAALILLFTAFYHIDVEPSPNGAAKPVWTTALAQAAVWLGACILAIAMAEAGLPPFDISPFNIVILVAVAVYLLRSHPYGHTFGS